MAFYCSLQRVSAPPALSCNWMAVARAMLVPAARRCVVVGAVGEKAATDERPQAATKALRPRIVPPRSWTRAVVSFLAAVTGRTEGTGKFGAFSCVFSHGDHVSFSLGAPPTLMTMERGSTSHAASGVATLHMGGNSSGIDRLEQIYLQADY